MKPQVLHRGKGSARFTLVAFHYTRATSDGYVWCRTPEDVGKQVVRFLSDPNNSDIISIRRVYISKEEAERMEKSLEDGNENKQIDKSQTLD